MWIYGRGQASIPVLESSSFGGSLGRGCALGLTMRPPPLLRDQEEVETIYQSPPLPLALKVKWWLLWLTLLIWLGKGSLAHKDKCQIIYLIILVSILVILHSHRIMSNQDGSSTMKDYQDTLVVSLPSLVEDHLMTQEVPSGFPGGPLLFLKVVLQVFLVTWDLKAHTDSHSCGREVLY